MDFTSTIKLSLDDQIGSEALVDDDVAVADGDRRLTLNVKVPFAELVRLSCFVDRLEKAWAKDPVNGEWSVD